MSKTKEQIALEKREKKAAIEAAERAVETAREQVKAAEKALAVARKENS